MLFVTVVCSSLGESVKRYTVYGLDVTCTLSSDPLDQGSNAGKHLKEVSKHKAGYGMLTIML